MPAHINVTIATSSEHRDLKEHNACFADACFAREIAPLAHGPCISEACPMFLSRHSTIILEGFYCLDWCGKCKLLNCVFSIHPSTLPRTVIGFKFQLLMLMTLISGTVAAIEPTREGELVLAQPSSSGSGESFQETWWLELKDYKGRQPPHQFKAGLHKSGAWRHITFNAFAVNNSTANNVSCAHFCAPKCHV